MVAGHENLSQFGIDSEKSTQARWSMLFGTRSLGLAIRGQAVRLPMLRDRRHRWVLLAQFGIDLVEEVVTHLMVPMLILAGK